MCYLVRDAAGRPESAPAVPTGSDRARPRWAAAAGLVLVAGLATAALVAPSPTATSVKEPATVSPVAARSGATPVTPVIDQRGSGLDDDVPSLATRPAKAAAGNCEYGL